MLVIKNFVPHDTNQIGDEKKNSDWNYLLPFLLNLLAWIKKHVIVVEMLVTASLDVNWIVENLEVECNFKSGRQSTSKVLIFRGVWFVHDSC